MLMTIHNEIISLTVDSLGAQMMSLCLHDKTEYLWQGDASYWADRAPLLFPFIARLTNDSYRFQGTLYHMGIHGFAAGSPFRLVSQSENQLVLELTSSEETRKQYPFDFSLLVCYTLKENTVSISYQVSNLDSKTMPFGIGGHPGFRVPLQEDEQFEDYELEFSCACEPDRIGFTPSLYLSGREERYPLQDDRRLLLEHRLFDEDAVILRNMARQVTLHSRKSRRSVTVSYPDMPYLGIWHWPQTDAPYVCIEPWSSLPSRQDVVEELSCKSDLIQLAAGKQYNTCWTITIS